MKAEEFLKNEYGITDRLANLDLETENGTRNHYLTSLMERYAEEEIKNFVKFFEAENVKVLTKYLEKFYEIYEKENNK